MDKRLLLKRTYSEEGGCSGVCSIISVNHEKTFLKITCLEMNGFETSFAVTLFCPLALVKVCVTSSSATLGEGFHKMVKKAIYLWGLFRQPVLPNTT